MRANFFRSLRKIVEEECKKTPSTFNAFAKKNPWIFEAIRYDNKINFKGDNLQGINFSAPCRVDLSQKNFSEANLMYSIFSGVILQLAILEKVHACGIDLRNADLSGAILIEGNFKNAKFQHAKLNGTQLVKTDLEGAYLCGVTGDASTDFSGANLTNSNLTNANLPGVNFRNANLTNADLQGADLQGAIFDGAILDDTNLTALNTWGQKGLPILTIAGFINRLVKSYHEEDQEKVKMELMKIFMLEWQGSNGNGDGHKSGRKSIEKMVAEICN
jgi:uncharacterized protein YjbI with pentapeptide repeats